MFFQTKFSLMCPNCQQIERETKILFRNYEYKETINIIFSIPRVNFILNKTVMTIYSMISDG